MAEEKRKEILAKIGRQKKDLLTTIGELFDLKIQHPELESIEMHFLAVTVGDITEHLQREKGLYPTI